MTYTAFDRRISTQLEFLDVSRQGKDITALEFRDSSRAFSRKVIRPLDDIVEKTDSFPHPLWKTLGDQGLKSVIIPKQYGGLGLGYLDLCIATQEIAHASGAIAVSYVCDQALCSRQIVAFGTEEQKEKYLPKLASGDFVGALAMSEHEAGSDVMGMRTSARKVDGGYIINGSKIWITNGARRDPVTGELHTADILVLYAKTSSDPVRLTTFLVEGGTKGFKPVQLIEKNNARGSDTAELLFEECFVPDSHVLGEVGKGAHILMAGLNPERLTFSANTLGTAQAALEETTEYLANRRQFGLPLAFKQAVAHELADMYAQVHAAQDHMFAVAARADWKADTLDNASAASTFLRAARTSTYVTEQCRYLHGGNGQTTAYRIGRQTGISSLFRVGAGAEGVREMLLAIDLIPGYGQHLKAERAAFAPV